MRGYQMQGQLVSHRNAAGLAPDGEVGWGDYGIRFTGQRTSKYNFTANWGNIRGLIRSGEKIDLSWGDNNHAVLWIFSKGAAVLIEQIYQFARSNGRLPNEEEYAILETEARSTKETSFTMIFLAICAIVAIVALFSCHR